MKPRIYSLFVIAIIIFSPLFVSVPSVSKANNILTGLVASSSLPINDLEKGDLVFCDIKSSVATFADNYGLGYIQGCNGYSNDHVVMYIGNNKFIESCPYFYKPISKEYTGVVITTWWLLKTWATNFTYGRVDTTEKIKNDAIRWAKTQLLKPYGSNGYYCGELISNAYKTAGVELTVTYWDGRTNTAFGPTGLKSSNQVTMLSPNKLPVAIMTIDDYSKYDYQVYFNGYDSYDTDGRVMNWTWDFGDGIKDHEPFTGHRYSEPGNYTVTLTIIDDQKDSSTVSKNIEVLGDIPNIPDDDNDSDEENNNEDDENNTEDTNTDKFDKIKENGNSFLGILVIAVIIGIIILIIIGLLWVLRR